MKLLIGTLAALMFLIPTSAYGSFQDELEAADSSTYYELTYTQCSFRYETSDLSDRAIDCICSRLASHAVDHREKSPTEPVPPLPDSVEAACVNR